MADSLARQRLPKNSRISRALRKNPPERKMTRAKETKLLAIAIVFDALKFIFVWFWFFAPFIIGAVANAATGGGIEGKIAGYLGLATGAAISPAIGAIGIVLAMAVGAFGWMVLITVMAMSGIPLFSGSSRRFLKLFVAFCATEAPFIDMIPAFTPFVFSIIREERAADKKALAAHKAEQAAAEQQAQQQAQRAELMEQQQMMRLESAEQDQQMEEQTEQAETANAEAEAENTPEEEAPRAPYERAPRAPLVAMPSLISEKIITRSSPHPSAPWYEKPLVNPAQTAHSSEHPTELLMQRLSNPKIKKQVVETLYAQNVRGAVIPSLFAPKSHLKTLVEHNLSEVSRYTPISLDPAATNHALTIPGLYLTGDIHSIAPHSEWDGKRMSSEQLAIAEAHEKGHALRPYTNPKSQGYSPQGLFGRGFDPRNIDHEKYHAQLAASIENPPSLEEVKEGMANELLSDTEITERMSQLKNYFGMRGDETFTKAHLDYARDHYVRDTAMDNGMTEFFQAVTPQTEGAFLETINTRGI